MKCPKCGTHNNNGSKFCTGCGTPIKTNKFSNIIWWCVTALCLLLAVVFIPSAASVLFLSLAVISAPILKVKEIYHKIVPKKGIRVTIAIVLFLLCFFTIPETEVDNPNPTETTSMDVSDASSDSESETETKEIETTTSKEEVTVEPPATETTTEPDEETTAPPEEDTTTYPVNDTTEPPKEETTAPKEETTAPKEETTAPPKEDTTPVESSFSIHFIDVGQADAALVECDGQYMLIDGGNKADSSLLYTLLKNAGVKHLKMVVGTHAHEDHIGGLPGAFNYATADITLCPVKSYDSDAFEDFAKYANSKGGGITVPKVGDTYKLGSATVKILGVNGGSDPNDTSIVLKITYGKTTFLFTGDAEREAEQAIINSGADLSATVLKVGHHGSDTSTSYVFLREIMPQYAVISVGEGNSYGHPTDDTLSRLRDADVKTFRTDMQGDIYCTSDGKTVNFTVERNKNADTLASVGNNSTVPDTDPPSDGITYVLNTNTMKFHHPDCSSVEKMSEKNKEETTLSREELIEKGYKPCGNCDP